LWQGIGNDERHRVTHVQIPCVIGSRLKLGIRQGMVLIQHASFPQHSLPVLAPIMSSVHIILTTISNTHRVASPSQPMICYPPAISTHCTLNQATPKTLWLSTFTLHGANIHTHCEEYKYDAYKQAKGVSKQLYSTTKPPLSLTKKSAKQCHHDNISERQQKHNAYTSFPRASPLVPMPCSSNPSIGNI
jgi:hypothetical protein